MSLKTRLDRLQSHYQRRTIAAIAAEYGLSLDELLEEAKAFFALPLAEQLAQVESLEAKLRAEGMRTDEIAEIKQTLIREYRPT